MCQTKGDWVCKSTDEGKKGLDVYDTYEKTRAIAERNEFGAFSVFPILFCFCKPPVSIIQHPSEFGITVLITVSKI